jgi:hypothetical protein
MRRARRGRHHCALQASVTARRKLATIASGRTAHTNFARVKRVGLPEPARSLGDDRGVDQLSHIHRSAPALLPLRGLNRICKRGRAFHQGFLGQNVSEHASA